MPPFLVDDSFDYKLTYFRVNGLDEGLSLIHIFIPVTLCTVSNMLIYIQTLRSLCSQLE